MNIDVSSKSSWSDKLFLTFDLDWCADEILTYLLDILDDHDVICTFFVTHKSPLLNKLIDNTKFELGIHPNFNPLLESNYKFGNSMEQVIKYYKNILPQPTSIRSHSLTQNSNYLNMLSHYGFKHECNNYIPLNSKIVLYPYLHWDKKLTRVPHFWEDDIHFQYGDDWNLKLYKEYSGIKVFDFHPIHVFLNTENIQRYERTRHLHQKPSKLAKHRYEGVGTLNILLDLLSQK